MKATGVDSRAGRLVERKIRHTHRRIVLCVAYLEEVAVYARTGKIRGRLVTVTARKEDIHPSRMRKYRVVLERMPRWR